MALYADLLYAISDETKEFLPKMFDQLIVALYLKIWKYLTNRVIGEQRNYSRNNKEIIDCVNYCQLSTEKKNDYRSVIDNDLCI